MRDGKKVGRTVHETTNKMVVSTYEYMRKAGKNPIMTEFTSKTIRIIYNEGECNE